MTVAHKAPVKQARTATKTERSPVAFGFCPGHGFTKAVAIDEAGNEYHSTFPSLIAPAQRTAAGSIVETTTIEHRGRMWWVGDDALIDSNPLSILSHSRLYDLDYIPVLTKAALTALNLPGGTCVTGLPASWSNDRTKAEALGHRIREGSDQEYFNRIRCIAEPIGALYNEALDVHGNETTSEYRTSRVVMIDIGHVTVDVSESYRMQIVTDKLISFDYGTSVALQKIQAMISGTLGRYPSLYETDLAVRKQSIRIAGMETDLPHGWARPLHELGDAIGSRLSDVFRGGANIDIIMIAGGGSACQPLVDGIQKHFPGARPVQDGQLSVARGYAKLARRFQRGV